MSDELQRNQPCGCIVCVCEDNEQCHGCGAKHCGTHPIGEIPNPAYIPMTPHALTMEQVITLESGGQGAVNVALRLCQTLTQQAQEVERLKVDLQEHRTICRKATQAIIDAIGSDGPENIDHAVDRLIAKLATMMAERDEQGKLKADLYERFLEAQKQLITQDIQLEASQARVRELEAIINKADYRHIMDPPDGGDPTLTEKAQYLVDRISHANTQLAALQATLAAREAKYQKTISESIDQIDLQCDEFNRIKAITDNEEIKGICDRAVRDIGQRVPVIQQRDAAVQDAARLREALEALWRMTEIYKITDLDAHAVISKALKGA